MALLFRSQKTISDHSNGISLLPDEGTEDVAKGMSKIGPETVVNDQFPSAMVETGRFSSRRMAVEKPALSWPFFMGLNYRMAPLEDLCLLYPKCHGCLVTVADCCIPLQFLTAIVDQNSPQRIFDLGGSRPILLRSRYFYGKVAELDKSFLVV